MRKPRVTIKRLGMAALGGAALVLSIAYFYADTIIEVPEHTRGFMGSNQLPDSHYTSTALVFAALTQTFQFDTAAKQFSIAKPLLWGVTV